MTAIGSTRDETIRRMIAESDKFVAEQRRLMAESVRSEQERSMPSWLRIGGRGGRHLGRAARPRVRVA